MDGVVYREGDGNERGTNGKPTHEIETDVGNVVSVVSPRNTHRRERRLTSAVPSPPSPGLELVYPNPFNPSTTVRFTLRRTGPVQLSVLDLRGHVVRHLVQGAFPAGTHEIKWDGLDDRSQPTASGIYFIELRSSQGRESRKVVILK
jgi:hypothetical protein